MVIRDLIARLNELDNDLSIMAKIGQASNAALFVDLFGNSNGAPTIFLSDERPLPSVKKSETLLKEIEIWVNESVNYQPESNVFLVNSFDSSVKISSLKKGLKASSGKITKDLLLNFLVKPLFRIDILLSRLHFFSSSYQARQFISNGFVKINGKKVNGNFLLKKGDIISFDLFKIQENFKFSNQNI